MVKRLFDIIASTIALLFLLPLFLPIMLVLRFTGEREVFYFQDRIGKEGKPIKIYKFATMLKNSEYTGSGIYTAKNDPRILPVGVFLRKTKINELPQIMNVLIGDLSVVGPRPLIERTYNLYSEDIKLKISSLKPGLTGIGSLIFRDEESILYETDLPLEEYYEKFISPHKGRLEVWYKENQSFLTDLKIIILTAWIIIFPSSNLIDYFFNNLPKKDISHSK